MHKQVAPSLEAIWDLWWSEHRMWLWNAVLHFTFSLFPFSVFLVKFIQASCHLGGDRHSGRAKPSQANSNWPGRLGSQAHFCVNKAILFCSSRGPGFCGAHYSLEFLTNTVNAHMQPFTSLPNNLFLLLTGPARSSPHKLPQIHNLVTAENHSPFSLISAKGGATNPPCLSSPHKSTSSPVVFHCWHKSPLTERTIDKCQTALRHHNTYL